MLVLRGAAFLRAHTYQIRQAVPLHAYAGELSGIMRSSSNTATAFTTASAGTVFVRIRVEQT